MYDTEYDELTGRAAISRCEMPTESVHHPKNGGTDSTHLKSTEQAIKLRKGMTPALIMAAIWPTGK